MSFLGVSHGSTEGTEVGLSDAGGLAELWGLGEVWRGVFLPEVGKYLEISLLCVREVLNYLRVLRASVRGFLWWSGQVQGGFRLGRFVSVRASGSFLRLGRWP